LTFVNPASKRSNNLSGNNSSERKAAMEETNQSQKVQVATRQLLKKITPKTVCGKVSIEKLIEHVKENGKDSVMPLYGIIGKASDALPGQSDLGPYVKFLGDFKAVAVESGEVFRSGCAILPGAASDLVYGALKARVEVGGAIEFGFRVGVKRDETSATGYVYVVEQVYQPQEQDALSALEARLAPPANVQQITDKTGTGSKKGK
jgi:hypothetical protein